MVSSDCFYNRRIGFYMSLVDSFSCISVMSVEENNVWAIILPVINRKFVRYCEVVTDFVVQVEKLSYCSR